jgi:hypothetical protein
MAWSACAGKRAKARADGAWPRVVGAALAGADPGAGEFWRGIGFADYQLAVERRVP